VSRRRRAPRAAFLVVALLAVVALALWVIPSNEYIFLPDRARAVAPIVDVAGGKDPKDGGGIYFVDIFVRKATLLERLWPGIREGAQLVPASAILAPGTTDAQRRQADRRAMTQSQEVAAAVALRAAGYKVTARPIGAVVQQVDPHAPASGVLEPGDVIVRVEGTPVRTTADLREVVGKRKPGDRITLVVRRGDSQRSLDVRLRQDPTRPGRAIIGVLIDQDADIDLPRRVKIDAGSIGGPSAGLAFALDVMEELGRDVDHGNKVAATGAIELDGTVSPIGGVRQKTIGVRRSGIDVFLVPAGDNAAEARRYADGIRIIPVRNFQQALRALATLPKDT
jgi:PDZ domain-containing protein